MDVQIYQVVLVPLALYALVRLYQYSKASTRQATFPPGPKTLPFIGNLHQIPTRQPQFEFTKFAKEFGPLTGLKLGSQNMVIINTWQAVRDLIEQKGSIYSSRPSIPVADIVVPGGLNPALCPYGDTWRKQRKMLVEFLGGDRSDRMKPVQDAESTQMIYEMLQDPSKFHNHIMRSFGAVILATVFGQRGKTIEAGETIETFFRIEDEWAAAAGPTASPPTKSFPFLRHVPDFLTPWRGWKKRALKVKSMQGKLYSHLLEDTRDKLAQGKGVDCFMAQCLKVQDREWYDDNYLKYVGGILMEGGAETSASTTLIFLMTMAAFPEVLKTAQEEVDRVCSVSRMPGKDDTNALPYIRACMQEVLRWRPILPLAVPHCTTADDTYGPYTIPAGTDVLLNTWNINHDEANFDSPSIFNPSRFLDDEFGNTPVNTDQKLDSDKGRRSTYAFGAGRRVCPGQRFAENTMMMHFAKLVWAFDIEATGKLPLDDWEEWSEGLVSRPRHLNVQLKLRDEGRRKVIEAAWAQADVFLSQFEH